MNKNFTFGLILGCVLGLFGSLTACEPAKPKDSHSDVAAPVKNPFFNPENGSHVTQILEDATPKFEAWQKKNYPVYAYKYSFEIHADYLTVVYTWHIDNVDASSTVWSAVYTNENLKSIIH